jgi:hypothetical protein
MHSFAGATILSCGSDESRDKLLKGFPWPVATAIAPAVQGDGFPRIPIADGSR